MIDLIHLKDTKIWTILVNQLQEMSTTTIYFVVIIMVTVCAMLLLHPLSKGSGRLNLPYFQVTSDVIATLEEAHRQVSQASAMHLDNYF